MPEIWTEWTALGSQHTDVYSGAELKERVRRFFNVTTDPRYLASEWSRRTLLSTLLPLLGISNIWFDVGELNRMQVPETMSIFWLDVAITVSFLIVYWLPRSKLWADAVVVAILAVHTVSRHMTGSNHKFLEVFWTVVLCFCGVHSCFVSVYGFISSLSLCLFSFASGISALCYVAIFLVFGAFNIECKLTSSWSKLEESDAAMRLIVSHATNGTCVVDPVSGEIQSASSELKRAFGVEDLEGAIFTNFVTESDAHLISNMLASADHDVLAYPMTVTCHIREQPTRSQVFGVKIIPYNLSKDGINLCVQVISESQNAHHSGQKAGSGQKASGSTLVGTESTYHLSSDTQEEISWISSKGVLFVERGMQTIPAAHSPARPALPRPPSDIERLRGLLESPDSTSSATGSGGSGSRGESPGRRSRRRTENHRPRQELDEFSSEKEEVQWQLLMPLFEPTSPDTCIGTAKWLFKHWNLPYDRSSCCPWHAYVQVTMRLLEMQLESPCEPLWSAMTGWQCPKCLATNKATMKSCQLCDRIHHTDSSTPSELFKLRL